jgi:isopenicillin-N N-acyltransferase like protein
MTRKLRTLFFWIALLILNWAVCSYHAGVFPPPKIAADEMKRAAPDAQWIDKKVYGMHQLIVSGTSYERGLQSGRLEGPLLLREENELVSKLQNFFPNKVALQGFTLVLMNWFNGIERYFEPWMVEELYGVSKSAPHEFDYLADGLTRQVAYHGLHEVGQMMVDQKGDDVGCTVVATPYKGSWILGRNFDFEGGRIFDEEKVLKWVFPSQGNAFVSVTWAGMVGVVTGVNARGLYISLNAAGSRDFRRYGTPSTLVLLKALQFANSLDEALGILKTETMFITDIFVLLDAESGRMVRVEKSPRATEVLELTSPVTVANHLVSDRWKNDSINLFRRNDLTSAYRESRGKALVDQLDKEKIQDPAQLERRVLGILRDKGDDSRLRQALDPPLSRPLNLGNRRSIDALIATHSVVYNAKDQILFVSQGPSLAGAFTGFDLKASFLARSPRLSARRLERDPLVSDLAYENIHKIEKQIGRAESFLRKKNCIEAENILDSTEEPYRERSEYYTARGNVEFCLQRKDKAQIDWRKALELQPAYAKEILNLKEKLSR